MEIHNHIRKLKAARAEAKKQAQLSTKLSIEIAGRVKAHVKKSGTTLATVATRSGLPYPTLINLFWGGLTHSLTGDEVMRVWKAAVPTKDQKFKATFKMRQLTPKDWELPNKDIARRIGCSQSSVRNFRQAMSCKK